MSEDKPKLKFPIRGIFSTFRTQNPDPKLFEVFRISGSYEFRISALFKSFLRWIQAINIPTKDSSIDTVIDRVTQIVRLPKQLLVFQYPMCVISVFQQFWKVFRISISPQQDPPVGLLPPKPQILPEQQHQSTLTFSFLHQNRQTIHDFKPP